MLFSKEEFLRKVIGDSLADDTDLPPGITKQNLATIRNRFKNGDMHVSSSTICRLAKVRSINPVLAMISLQFFRLEDEKGRDHLNDAQLLQAIHNDLEDCATTLQANTPQTHPCGGLTLANFPGAFGKRFVIVTGDRRETTGQWMTPADFGAVSSSAAELRHLHRLGLPRDTEIVSDKVFVLAPYDELKRRFGEKTIVCIGSPASNHASRILNQYAIYRYYLTRKDYKLIEESIGDAWYIGTSQNGTVVDKRNPPVQSDSVDTEFFVAQQSLAQFQYQALKEYLTSHMKDVKHIANHCFSMGIIDPTYDRLIRARRADHDRDFGIITLAQNPFRENDGLFPAVLLSGYHLPGTVYAMHKDIWDNREKFFEKHPFGGVIRVDLAPLINPDVKKYYAYYERMEYFKVQWDEENGYDPESLTTKLENMERDEYNLLTVIETQRLQEFVRKLRGTTCPKDAMD